MREQAVMREAGGAPGVMVWGPGPPKWQPLRSAQRWKIEFTEQEAL